MYLNVKQFSACAEILLCEAVTDNYLFHDLNTLLFSLFQVLEEAIHY
jgi:hypothetical protein